MSARRARLSDYGFFVVLIACGWLLWRTVSAVFIPVVLGAFVAVLVRPWYGWLLRRMHGRRRTAAAMTALAVVFLVLVPLILLGWALVGQLASAVSTIAGAVQHEGLVHSLERLPLVRHLQLSDESVKKVADAMISWSAAKAGMVALGLSSALVGSFLLMISLFYFLVDGYRWLEEVARLAPIEPRYVRAFFLEFDRVSHGLFYGNIVAALIQGAVAAVGYWLFGVEQPVFWGAATALCSLVPVVGTALVWAPMAAIVATTSPSRGIGIGLWGAGIIAFLVDDFVRPQLMRGHMQLHPLMVFLSILGGAFAFGAVGLLVGPMAASLFFAALRIYDRDYRARRPS
jgi:predicted PurR-regulated permease PerM